MLSWLCFTEEAAVDESYSSSDTDEYVAPPSSNSSVESRTYHLRPRRVVSYAEEEEIME